MQAESAPLTHFQLIKRLAHTLRYYPLLDLIGKTANITGLATVEHDILEALHGWLPGDCRLIKPEARFVKVALAKYGLMDLTFQLPAPPLDREYESGISVLKKLGFLRANVKN